MTIGRTLARLLHYANAEPPREMKPEFYALKKRLLERYADPVGFDVQHIEGKRCWTCGGTGVYVGYHTYSGDEWEDTCNRCWGTGWFKDPVWIVLNKFQWHGFKFHIPGERKYKRPDPDVTNIRGYVEHTDYGDKSEIAFVWLCLLLGHWRLAWKWFNSGWRRVQWWRRHPFYWIQRCICFARALYRRTSNRCVECKRRLWTNRTVRCKSCDDNMGLGDPPF